MVKRETYGVFNVCLERLRDPPGVPKGVTAWHGYPIEALLRLVPFAEERLSDIDPGSDFVGICELLNIGPPVDVAAEFRKFVSELGLKPLLAARGSRALHAGARGQLLAAAKYPFVLRYVLRRVVGEDLVFAAELPYLVETESDFLASFSLIAGGYGKQAVQLLRGVLEVAVAHAHFGLLGDDYYRLASAADFQMPRFGGRKGMLDHLLRDGVVDETFANECSKLYSRLSSAVHSHIHRLSVDETFDDTCAFWAEAAGRVGTLLLRLIFLLLKRGV